MQISKHKRYPTGVFVSVLENLGRIQVQTCPPVLRVLVLKSAGSVDVHPYFSKYGHRISRKYGNRDVKDASLLPAKPIVEH